MRPRLRLGLVPLAGTFVVAVCVSIVAIAGWRTVHARHTQLGEGAIAVDNLTKFIAQHVTDTLKEVDSTTLLLADRLESADDPTSVMTHLRDVSRRLVAKMPQIDRLAILDANGVCVASTLRFEDGPDDVARREYFVHHRDSASRDVFVGPAIRSASNGQWQITLSHRVDRRDGSFGGVVLASIDLDYFDAFFSKLNIGDHGTLVLATMDGTLINRRPYRADLLGSNLSDKPLFRDHVSRVSEGLVTQVSALDRVERQIAFKRLDDYPLYVVAALAVDETLAAWRADAAVHSAFIVVVVLALGASGFLIVRVIKRRGEVTLKLVGSQRELESLNRQLASMAREDALTRLVNRRELDRVLAEEIGRAQHASLPLAVIMVDVDHFKFFNDRYGHPAGDACLQAIGAILTRCVHRAGDIVARYGGEEFAIVLPGSDLTGGLSVAETLRVAIRAEAIAHVDTPSGYVTISAGVAAFDPARGPVTAEALVRSADRALYRSKRAGRDTVDASRSLLAA